MKATTTTTTKRRPGISTRISAIEGRQKASEDMGRDHGRRLARLEQSWESWMKEALGKVLQASYDSRQKAQEAIERMNEFELESARGSKELRAAIADLDAKVDALACGPAGRARLRMETTNAHGPTD